MYLSGAPRLSTKASTESLGPRSHILGVIRGFEQHGVEIDRFIVGDAMPDAVHGQGSEGRMSSGVLPLLAADVFRFASRLRSRLQLKMRARNRSLDFVYERYALFQELGSVARRETGALWILEVNALLAVEATSERRATTSRRLAEWMEKRTLRRADVIVAVTQALADQLGSHYGIPAERMLVVANGVDHTVHHAAVPITLASTPRIGFLGTLYPWQNVSSLVALLSAEGLLAAELHIAGDGPERAALEQQARALGVEGRVHFRGRVHPDEVPEFLAGVDLCFAGHSSANGSYFSPLKLWEYLAAGKPVVASRHEVTADLESQGFAVVCYDPSGADDLKSVLTRSVASLADLSRRAADKQRDVWAEHSWGRRVETILDSVRVP
ncbi:glycosyltransferase [Rathayibacter sp. VKM Ac-2759]|uniref:glycosyltransferase n=1 Tax=Rathayibacter sp. VKM Ac-2759 TaxID=2609252 RepID=UPI001FC91519|nr:glycosyltransferase [Rathayibacter sp. VKM Ac-2759]